MSAGLLLTGARIATGDPERPAASALLVRDGRIVALGDPSAVEAQARGTDVERLDARGRRVTPGLADAHVHVGLAAARALALRIPATADPETASRLVARAHRALPDGAWLTGGGQNAAAWTTPADRAFLDRLVGARPALLANYDAHGAWANSAALAVAGITRATPDPPGGRIGRDAAGEPDGRLEEAAVELVRRHVPPPDEARLLAASEAFLRDAAARGATMVHAFEDGAGWARLAALRAAGRLPVRVAVAFMAGALTGDDPTAADWAPPANGDGLLFAFALKGFLDGTLGSATAHLLGPADDGTGRGIATLDRDGIARLSMAARRHDLALALHAIGDGAVRAGLDAFAAWPAEERARRVPRIEHAQLVDPADVPRFAALGVVASMQPLHCVADRAVARVRWGARDATGGYAWRALDRAGAVLALGSDAPIEPCDPRATLAAAVLGGDPAATARGEVPARALPFDRAFTASTRGAAFAAGCADRVGTLAAGFHADFVVWDDDPCTLPAARLAEAAVGATYVGGRRVGEGAV